MVKARKVRKIKEKNFLNEKLNLEPEKAGRQSDIYKSLIVCVFVNAVQRHAQWGKTDTRALAR